MKEEKYIKIRQNISWNRIGSKILVRNSWKSVLTAECFFKKLGFSTDSLAPETLHDKVVGCPGVIVEGLAVKEAMVGVEFGLITWST
jgi:hypothetical protein